MSEIGAKGTRFCGQVLDAVFFDDPLPFAGVPSFVLSLHTGAPESADGTLQNEVTYRGYRAVELPRRRGTFERNGNLIRNVVEARFPTCDEAETQSIEVSHWALRPVMGGAAIYAGKFGKSITVKAMVRPVVDPGMIEVREK